MKNKTTISLLAILIILLIGLFIITTSSCSTYKTATSTCAAYNDSKALKKRSDYPKLHKKNQFNPRKNYK